jgi:hemerythrin
LQAEHKRLTGQVVELREKHRKNAITLTLEVMPFLKKRLANHITGRDRQYTAELNYAVVLTEPTRLLSKSAMSASWARI